MKTLKSLFLVLLVGFVLVFAGCSKSDPTPSTPIIPVYIGYWKFISATVIPMSGSTYDQVGYTACNGTTTPAFKVDFKLTTTTDAIQKSICFADAPLTYVGTLTGNKLTNIDFKDGSSKAYSFTNIVIDETNKTITANQILPFDASKLKSIVVHFQLQ